MKRYYNTELFKELIPYIERGASEEEIQQFIAARKKKAKAGWQRNRRAEMKQFTVSLTKKELRIINYAAKGHKQSKTKFIKQSALAYCTKSFLALDEELVREVGEKLTMNYSLLQQLMEQQSFSEEEQKDTLKQMHQFQEIVLNAIQHPKEITNWLKGSDPMAQE